MNLTSTSTRQLRTGQLVLSALAAGLLFFPWISYRVPMMTSGEWRSDIGIASPFGACLAVFLGGSVLTSVFEATLDRRVTFIHVGLFAATLIVGIAVLMLPYVPGSGDPRIGPAFHLYLLFAILGFALTGMLSGSRSRTST